MKLADYILKNRLYLDGALGSVLLSKGISTYKAEMLNLTNPQIIEDIHASYLAAGSKLIYANTFGANGIRYDDETLKQVIEAGVELAINAARPYDAYVAMVVGPLNELIEPFGKLTFDEAYEHYKKIAIICKPLKLDAVVIETVTDLLMLKAAVLAFKENTPHDVWCSMSFEQDGRAFTGAKIGSFALTAQGLGVNAIGINCSIGPDKMLPLAKELVSFANIPIFIKPNAGLPVFENGKTFYDVDANEFAKYMREIALLGVSILGGCCGTDENYIKRTIEATKGLPFEIFDNHIDAVCSASEIVEFVPTTVIGERINPTGKPTLKQALLDENLDYVVGLGVEQISDGAKILDVNVGMSGVDEAKTLKTAVLKLQSVAAAPLSIDSSRLQATEAALRVVGGVPLINSVNGDKQSMESVFPLAAKYGAYVVALCLDEGGIPETVLGRLEIAKKIIAKAAEYGIDKNRLLFDALTMSVSVNQQNANVTLDTLLALKTQLNVKTVLGLSNVSFGLPAREIINGVFYSLAKDLGATALIINPKLKPQSDSIALAALKGEDDKCQNYVEKFSGFKAEAVMAADLSISQCIVKGLKSDCLKKLNKIINADNYFRLIDDEVIKGLSDLGEAYERGKAFLPQLIAGAECATAALAVIKRFMPENAAVKATMLFATVKGDVHDIGKNIVKTVLQNYGFKIIDLGRDVAAETILDAVDEYKPQIVGLSALMTTSLDNMAETAKMLNALGQNILVLVGGAVVSENFAKQIGAVYTKDAQACAKYLNNIF